MSQQRTAKQICERALRAIGAFPVTESAADGEQLREAMDWLDILMAEKGGTGRLFSLVPNTLPIPIVNGTTDYNLNTALGADLPVDRIQFPVKAWLEDAQSNRSPVEIANRDRFESIFNATATGPVTMIYIDRLAPSPTLRIFPTPAATDSNSYTLKLVVQTYAPNVSPGGVTGTQPSASILTNFHQAWQRWLIFQLASDLGSGSIHKLPQASINNFDLKARTSLAALEAFENREHQTSDPVCEPHGM